MGSVSHNNPGPHVHGPTQSCFIRVSSILFDGVSFVAYFNRQPFNFTDTEVFFLVKSMVLLGYLLLQAAVHLGQDRQLQNVAQGPSSE